MIKIVSMILLFCASGYLGFQVANVYKAKQDFYVDLLSFTKSIKNEISFMKTDILTILQKYEYKSQFNKFLKDYQNLLKLKNYNKNEIDKILATFSFLNEYEKNTINQMFFELGNIGYTEQLERLNFNENVFKETLEKSREKSDKMMPFCKKIGFLMGALVCIVLI